MAADLEDVPDVLCFSETWLQQNEKQSIYIEGYKLTSNYSRIHMQHGGCSIYTKSSSDFIDGLPSITVNSIEGQFEYSCSVSKNLKVLIICLYRTNLGSLEMFFESLTVLLDECSRKYKHFKMIICGDFNICLLEKNYQNSKFLDIMLSYNFQQTIFSPTRTTKSTETLIDNIFTNFECQAGTNIITALSDHHAQIVKISLDNNKINKQRQKSIIYSKEKLKDFQKELVNAQWDEIFSETNSNQAYEKFLQILTSIKSCIFQPKRVTRSKSRSWITKGIKISSRTKRKLYEQQKSGIIPIETYKKYAYILKKVVKTAKQMKNISYISNSKNKNKAIHQIIKSYTSNNRDSKYTCILNDFKKDSLSNNETEILNKINNFFIHACDSNSSPHSYISKSNIEPNKSSVFFNPTSPVEIHQIIMELKNTNSVGDDDIPVKLLKHNANIISQPLSHIINISLADGVFPEKLKIAKIKTIFKKGERGIYGNYRPIALLSNISKIFERVIYNRLLDFFDRCAILADSQNGFRKNRSTSRAIYVAITNIIESLNNNVNTIAIFLDLSKAFDSVNYEKLLEKLETYGIRGLPLKLLKSYLYNREQYVEEINENGETIKSIKKRIFRGVPQGSILGPLLYLLYTNDLSSIIKEFIIQFADDTTLVISDKNEEVLRQRILASMDILKKWFAANDLMLNIEKTHLLKFQFQKEETTEIILQDIKLTTEKQVKFLGIHLDSRLRWEHQIDCLSKEIARHCYSLRMLSLHVNCETALIAYHSYVESRIRYGIIFWGGVKQSERLFILQKRCVRNIFQIKHRDSCKPYFQTNGILTITSLYILEGVIFVKNNRDLFKINERHHDHATRHKADLLPYKTNYSYLQKNVHHSLIKIFNKLPHSLREQTVSLLKHKLKVWLLKRAYYALQEYLDDNDLKYLN